MIDWRDLRDLTTADILNSTSEERFFTVESDGLLKRVLLREALAGTHGLTTHAARANFLGLKLFSLFCCLTVFLVLSCLVNLLLKALVFLSLKSPGVLPFLVSSRAWVLLFSLITVKTLAMAFLTTYRARISKWTTGARRWTYSDSGELGLGSGGNLANSQLSQFFLKGAMSTQGDSLLWTWWVPRQGLSRP